MPSGYIPPKGESDPDEIVAALREALQRVALILTCLRHACPTCPAHRITG